MALIVTSPQHKNFFAFQCQTCRRPGFCRHGPPPLNKNSFPTWDMPPPSHREAHLLDLSRPPDQEEAFPSRSLAPPPPVAPNRASRRTASTGHHLRSDNSFWPFNRYRSPPSRVSRLFPPRALISIVVFPTPICSDRLFLSLNAPPKHQLFTSNRLSHMQTFCVFTFFILILELPRSVLGGALLFHEIIFFLCFPPGAADPGRFPSKDSSDYVTASPIGIRMSKHRSRPSSFPRNRCPCAAPISPFLPSVSFGRNYHCSSASFPSELRTDLPWGIRRADDLPVWTWLQRHISYAEPLFFCLCFKSGNACDLTWCPKQ